MIVDGPPDAPLVDAEVDAFVDPILRIAVPLEELLAVEPPDVRSTYGVAWSGDPYLGTGTSWEFRKPSPGHPAEKFELYLPFAEPGGSPVLATIQAHLGVVTIADIASIKVHTRRTSGTVNDFALIAYTTMDGTDDDGSWYGRRLHASLEWADALAAPTGTWNAFSTAAGTNQIRFWDFRNANQGAGVQPADNFFTLAAMQAGPVTPTGVTGARDYRTEALKFLSFSTFSEVTQFNGAIDGIEIELTSGKGVHIDLTGDADQRHSKVSLTQLRANHATGNSYGATAASTTMPFAGASSWNYVKDGSSPAADKLEVYLPFTITQTAAVDPMWDAVSLHLGEFTIADIASIQVHSRKAATTATDFTLLVYTLPDGTDDDASWFGRRLHGSFEWAASLAAPADTWNAFSTAAGTNQLRFWDFRAANVNTGAQPAANFSTLAELQAGPVVPTGTVLAPRDYRTEVVQYITLSTYSDYAAFDGSIDGIDIRLTSGKRLYLDLEQ